jgi:hypothetical protein
MFTAPRARAVYVNMYMCDIFLPFSQNAKGLSKDDVLVPLTSEKKGPKEKDPNR